MPLLGWCAATLTSIGLAAVAMLPVLRTASPDDGTLVSVDQLRETGDLVPTPGPTTAAPTASPPPASASQSRSPHKSRTPSSRTKSSKPPAATTPPTPSPSKSEKPTTSTEDGWTVTTESDGARTYVRSFTVEGGRTVIQAADGVIKLVTATPADGWSVARVQDTPDNLAVYFNEVNHSFIVHVVWQAGKPVAQVSEVGT